MTMHISLTPELEKIVKEKVAEGRQLVWEWKKNDIALFIIYLNNH